MEENSDTQRIPTDTESNPCERMFDKFKSYIDVRLAAINVEGKQSLDLFLQRQCLVESPIVL